MQSEGACRFRYVSQRGLGSRGIGRIDQHGNPNGLGHQVVQEPQPLGHNFSDEKIDAGRIAARPGKAGDQTQLDRVFADAEDDRDRRGRSFGRKCSSSKAGRGDHGHATADEVSHERRQAIVLALQPVVLDHHVLALDVAGFVEAFAERSRLGARQASADRLLTKPTTGIAGCCARAANGPRSAAPPASVMNSRRFIR